MSSKTVGTMLLIGMLCAGLSATENKTNQGGAAANRAAPAADAAKELKTSVEALAPTPTDRTFQGSLQLAAVVAVAGFVFLLVSAIWLFLASRNLAQLPAGIATENFVTAARTDLRQHVTDTMNGAVNTVRNDVTAAVNAARDQVLPGVAGARADLALVIPAVNAARDLVHADVAGAILAVNAARESLHADVAGARADVATVISAVNAARDTLHNDVLNAMQTMNNVRDETHADMVQLRQSLDEVKISLQGVRDDLKAKLGPRTQ
jgi:hypothetical protein